MKTNEQYSHIDMTFYNKTLITFMTALCLCFFHCWFPFSLDSTRFPFLWILSVFSVLWMNSVCFPFLWIHSVCFLFLWLHSFYLFHIYSIFMTGLRQFFFHDESVFNDWIPCQLHFFYNFFFDWIFFYWILHILYINTIFIAGFQPCFSTSIPFLWMESTCFFPMLIPFLWLHSVHVFHFYEFILSMFSIFMTLSFLSFPYLFNFYGWILTVVVFSMAIPFNLLYFYFFNWIVHFYCCIPSVEYEWNPPVFFPCWFHFYDLIPPEISMLIPFILLHAFLFFHFHEFIPSIFMNAFCLCFPLLWINSVRVFYFRVFHFYDCIPSVFSTSNLFLWLDSTCIFHVDFISFSLDWFLDSACLLPPPPPPVD